MVVGLLRPCVMCHSHCVCVCVLCLAATGTGPLCRDVCRSTIMCTCALWRTYGRGVQGCASVEAPCRRGREGSRCRGLPKGFMSEGIRPSQLSGGLIFRWWWVRFPGHKSAACIKGRVSRLQAETRTCWLEVLITADHVITKLNQFPAGNQVTFGT